MEIRHSFILEATFYAVLVEGMLQYLDKLVYVVRGEELVMCSEADPRTC